MQGETQTVFNEDQTMLADMLDAFMRERYTPEMRAEAVASEEGYSVEIWQSLASELGILGAALPEEVGGLGGGVIEHLTVMMALGSVAAVEPYFETCVVAAGLLSRSQSPLAAELAGGIAEGKVRFAIGAIPGMSWAANPIPQIGASDQGRTLSGSARMVSRIAAATHIMIAARDGDRPDGIAIAVLPVDASGLSVDRYGLLDGTSAADLHFDSVKLSDDAVIRSGTLGDADLAMVSDEAMIALCGEAVGIMRRLIRDTVNYTQQRRQFGQSLDSFQVLQHRMADMFVALKQCEAITNLAALPSSRGDAPDRATVAAAKSLVSARLREVAQQAVQVHGAIGMTDELIIGHLFRRATLIEIFGGSPDFFRSRYAEEAVEKPRQNQSAKRAAM